MIHFCLFDILSKNDINRVRKLSLAEYYSPIDIIFQRRLIFECQSISDVIGRTLKSDSDMSDLHSLGRSGEFLQIKC